MAYKVPIDTFCIISRRPGSSIVLIDSLLLSLQSFYTATPLQISSHIVNIILHKPNPQYVVRRTSTSRSLEPESWTDTMGGYRTLYCNLEQLASGFPNQMECNIFQEVFSVLNEGDFTTRFFRCMEPSGISPETHFLLLFEVEDARQTTPSTPALASPEQEQGPDHTTTPVLSEYSSSAMEGFPHTPPPTSSHEVETSKSSSVGSLLLSNPQVDKAMIKNARFLPSFGRSLYKQATNFYASCKLLEALGVDMRSVVSSRGIDGRALIPGSEVQIASLLTSDQIGWTMSTFNKKIRHYTWAEEIASWELRTSGLEIPCEFMFQLDSTNFSNESDGSCNFS